MKNGVFPIDATIFTLCYGRFIFAGIFLSGDEFYLNTKFITVA